MENIDNKDFLKSTGLVTEDNLELKDIESQHEIFFKLLDVITSYKPESEDSNKTLYNIVIGLESYSKTQFTQEEELMRRTNYEETDEHIAHHKIFQEKVDEFKTIYQFDHSILTSQMIRFMQKWLVSHIFVDDEKYVNHLTSYFSLNRNKH